MWASSTSASTTLQGTSLARIGTPAPPVAIACIPHCVANLQGPVFPTPFSKAPSRLHSSSRHRHGTMAAYDFATRAVNYASLNALRKWNPRGHCKACLEGSEARWRGGTGTGARRGVLVAPHARERAAGRAPRKKRASAAGLREAEPRIRCDPCRVSCSRFSRMQQQAMTDDPALAALFPLQRTKHQCAVFGFQLSPPIPTARRNYPQGERTVAGDRRHSHLIPVPPSSVVSPFPRCPEVLPPGV